MKVVIVRGVILLILIYSSFAQAFTWQKGELGQAGFNDEGFAKFIDYAFSKELDGIRTESLLIIKKEKIIYERYEYGFDKDKKHRIWSITKSFINAMFGILENQGKIKLNDPISKYLQGFPAFQDAKFKKVTIESLLRMNSGLQWDESYTNPFKSNVIKMLYGKVKNDMGGYAARVGLEDSPKDEFKYSSGTSNLLMLIFKKIVNDKEAHNQFPWNELFSKLNMKDVTWEQDESGTFVGSSYIFISPRDLAKYCQLFMNKGRVGNQQVLKPSWVKKSLIPSMESLKSSEDRKWYGYGMHFWTNLHADGSLKHKFLPKDLFFGLGHNGQIMACFPSENLILIRNAHDTKKLDRDIFFRKLWEAYGKYTK